jgi:NADH-quinone oxidoreductase subunit H
LDTGVTVTTSPLLSARLAKADLRINPVTAKKMLLAHDMHVMLPVDGAAYPVRIVLDEKVPEGTALIPRSVGVPIHEPQVAQVVPDEVTMIDAALIWEWVIKAVVILLVMTGGFAYVTWYERRALARMQVRIGPNRVGWQGLLQPVADGIKLIFKEELIPEGADKIIFVLAPVITVIPALIITAVVPWGTSVTIAGRVIPLHLADINVAVLYIMSVTSISIYGITLAGWSSNNKYAMLGGLRATAQMISYELALGLAFVGPILWAGSMSLSAIVEAQKNLWFIIIMPLGFVIYLIASLAEVNRSPFDMPEPNRN